MFRSGKMYKVKSLKNDTVIVAECIKVGYKTVSFIINGVVRRLPLIKGSISHWGETKMYTVKFSDIVEDMKEPVEKSKEVETTDEITDFISEEDLTRSELEEAIIKNIVKFNEFAVNKIKEYSHHEHILKVYTSPTYNYRVDEITSYSKYTQKYVDRYGISQLTHLVASSIDYNNTKIICYDIDEEYIYIWGSFANEDDNEKEEFNKRLSEMYDIQHKKMMNFGIVYLIRKRHI